MSNSDMSQLGGTVVKELVTISPVNKKADVDTFSFRNSSVFRLLQVEACVNVIVIEFCLCHHENGNTHQRSTDMEIDRAGVARSISALLFFLAVVGSVWLFDY